MWDWLVTPACPVCQKPIQQGCRCFCRDCQRQLEQQRFQPWRDPDGIHPSCPIYTWGRYEGSLRQALKSLKYGQQKDMGILLGEWMGQVWQQEKHRGAATVIPIPLHPDKLKQRGYNQADLLAVGFCRQTGYRHQPHALTRIRDTTAQYNLTAQERQRNLQGAFRLAQPVKPPVLIIDDIYTTGSTVKTALEVFQRAGIPVMGVLALARPTWIPKETNDKVPF